MTEADGVYEFFFSGTALIIPRHRFADHPQAIK